MYIKTYLFLFSFFGGCAASLWYPTIGVVTYMSLYFLSPNQEYWGAAISHWGIRYYLVAAACLAVGMALKWGSLKVRSSHLTRLEWVFLLFLAIAWLSGFLGIGITKESWLLLDKMTKIIVFLFLMTHCVTSMDRYKAVRWVWVLGGLYLGYRSFYIDPSDFLGGRLSGIGGPDFKGSSALAAHMAMTLPLIGVTFFLERKWFTRFICIASGVFVLNSLIQMRTRGAFLAVVVGGIVAVLAAPKAFRKRILPWLFLACIAGYSLADVHYWERISSVRDFEDYDRSTQVRLDIWRGSLDMVASYPQGVGIGNFKNVIGEFAPDHAGRSSHNTFILFAADLGIHGLAVYLLMLVLVAKSLLSIRTLGNQYEYLREAQLEAFGLGLSILIALSAGFFTERAYAEGLWWLFAMVVCLERSVQNAIAEREAGSASGSVKEALIKFPNLQTR